MAVDVYASLIRPLVAVVTAVLLSGAPRMVPARSAGGDYKCQCHHGATRCQCCARMRLAAKQQAPPCHRGTERESPRPASAGACLRSYCGLPEAHVQQQRTGTDEFTVSEAVKGSAPSGGDSVFLPRPEQRERAQEPDTPPPRLG